jgi:hypothetical protein
MATSAVATLLAERSVAGGSRRMDLVHEAVHELGTGRTRSIRR